MPRIEAETVAEHRAQQHDALLDAAKDILLDQGWDALSFQALGDRTGLARNSIYRYFASRDEMVAELCERELPRWLDAVRDAMTEATDIGDKAAAFAESQLKMVAAGHHRMAGVLANAPLSPEALARIHALSHTPTAQLEEALTDAGHPRPQVTAALVQGLVSAAFRLIQNGANDAEVIQATADAAQRAVES